jgi:hypothetical protein
LLTDSQLRRSVVYHGLELYYVYGVLPEIDALPDSVVLETQMDPNDGFGIPRAILGYNLFSKIVLNALRACSFVFYLFILTLLRIIIGRSRLPS